MFALKVARTVPGSTTRPRTIPTLTIPKSTSVTIRHGSSHPSSHVDVAKLLEKPTWSVESLLPPKKGNLDSPSITSKQLHHLLRLSALPPPASPEEEASMLDSLASHLHFVNTIRNVDTAGIKPLQSLRDETAAGVQEQQVTVEDLKEAFEQEEQKGSYYKRIRRRQDVLDDKEGAETWDVLGAAEKRVGRYFVVEGGKAGAE